MNNQEKAILVQIHGDQSPYQLEISSGYYGIKQFDNCFFKKKLIKKLSTKKPNLKDNVELVTNFLKKYKKKLLFGGTDICFDQGNGIMIEEYNHIEVPMGACRYIQSPKTVYTKHLAGCMGLGIYQPKTKIGGIYHFPGTNIELTSVLEENLQNDINKLGSDIDIHFASSYVCVDEFAQKNIQNSRIKVLKIFEKYAQKINNVNLTLCEQVGEVIEKFSLNCKDGLFECKIKTYSQEKMEKMNQEVNALMIQTGDYRFNK